MKHTRTKKVSFLVSLLMAFTLICPVSGPIALGQSSKGILAGTVTDPDGAVISGATIKITNNAKGTVRETTTADDGNYRLDAVDPGTYIAEVGTSGFKTATRGDITIAAGQAATSDFKLEVGSQGESINVTADSTAILQKQDGARTNTLEQRQIVDLPVVGLNPVNLVFTLPGVVDPGKAGGFVQGTDFSINGLRPRANSQLLDGTENNDIAIQGQAYQPTLRDGYQE